MRMEALADFMTEFDLTSGFKRIYATDLVYVPDCWKLCGDAHCCSFARYKSRFKMIARTPFQELPLLPGEYEFLASRGWLEQFGDHDHKVVEFAIDGYMLKAESIVSRKADCACVHNTRPTICRLYPLLPVFDLDGRLVGTEQIGIYEEIERVGNIEPACQLNSLPFDQVNKFLAIADELGKNPRHLYYLEAYRITKQHVANRLANRYKSQDRDIFAVFESGLIRQNLIDNELLRTTLGELARRFESRFGNDFHLAMGQA